MSLGVLAFYLLVCPSLWKPVTSWSGFGQYPTHERTKLGRTGIKHTHSEIAEHVFILVVQRYMTIKTHLKFIEYISRNYLSCQNS